MDFFAVGPAALSGILIGAAICGWAFARLQGWFAALEDGPVPAGQDASAAGALPAALHPSPSVDTARALWGAALAAADSLGELHAEINAYRRAENVFAGPDGQALHLCPPGEAVSSACGDPDEMGQRSCSLAD